MYSEAGDELLDRARQDLAAFGEIYDLYLRRVHAFCLSRTGNQEDAQDLTAQTFERALAAIGSYETRGAPLSSWLLRIAANLIADRARRGGRVVPLGEGAPPESASEDEEDDPAALVERWERATWLRRHIASLSQDQQEAIRLRYWEGRSTLEVAQQMGRSEGAIKQLLHRAVGSLRTRLQEEAVGRV
ncbi:MAG: RNA polymerase sigma factor [Chloroflexi bacterium]|nr:RNA polymerase sigma factor [Chloroflexota bacterium]